MSLFTLAISCLTTSNFPWFVNLTFQVLMQYCSYSISHNHNWVLFLHWLCLLILFGVISPLFFNRILGTYWPGKFIFQCHTFLPFHTVHGVLKARILRWLPFPSPVDQVLSELSAMTRPSWVALPGMALGFTELDKALARVISLVSFLWWWFSVCLPSDGEG